jgi:Ca2+-binding EF-hand superfamily protein
MESDYIDFKKIREYINITDYNLFCTYLKEVFNDLSDKFDNKKAIPKVSFLDYMKLPVFISEKVFSSLDSDCDGYLSLQEFVQGFSRLYLGDFEQSIEAVFKILDFDKDSYIDKEDVQILLSYLPLKIDSDESKIGYKYQMESLEEIDAILTQTFGVKRKLALNEFTQIVEIKKSDVYLQILCFLYQKKPFNVENINKLNVYRRKISVDDKEFLSPQPVSKRLPSPNRKSVLSPAQTFISINLLNIADDEEEEKEDMIKPMIRLPNEIKTVNKPINDYKEIIKNSQNIFRSPTMKMKKKLSSEFNLESNLISLNIGSEKDLYEDWVYKLTETLKLTKFWLVISGNDIYYYKTQQKKNYWGCIIFLPV